jgi:hypothetical protein
MKHDIISIPAFGPFAFTCGHPYRIRFNSRTALKESIDYDLFDAIVSEKHDNALYEIAGKGFTAIFLGFKCNNTIAVFSTYDIIILRGHSLLLESPDDVNINARDNCVTHDGYIAVEIDEVGYYEHTK